MNKQELLKAVHGLIWKSDDLIDQEVLFELQELIDSEIVAEAYPDQGKPTMKIKQHDNGYIYEIKIL